MTLTMSATDLFCEGDSRASSRAQLMDDQRGAVMLTGLFMAFVLIGGLWFVIGMGEAILFRDRMQEAADSAAFTSASIQANGMNFISALNIIMLILAIVHIILGVIQDVLRLLCASILLSAVACPAMFWEFNLWTNVSRVIKYGLTAIHYVEQVAAIGYPWLGTWKAHTVGGKYDATSGSGPVKDKVTVLAAGLSNIPITGTGLPVKAEPYSFLCRKVGQSIGNLIGQAVSSFGIPLGGRIGRMAGRFLGAGVELRYCNSLGNSAAQAAADAAEASMGDAINNADASDRRERERQRQQQQQQQNGGTATTTGVDSNGQACTGGPGCNTGGTTSGSRSSSGGFSVDLNPGGGWQPLIDPGIDRGWGNPGPYVVADRGKNGKIGARVFAVNLNPKYREKNARRVSAGQALKAGNSWATDSDEGSIFYIAEAEFYYDCKGKWKSDNCDMTENDRNASFTFKWRARLRRLDMPGFVNTIGNLGNNLLTFQAAAQDILGRIGNNPLAQAVGLDDLASSLSSQLDVIGDITRLDPTGVTTGSYH
jgi:hypothetical protein